MFPNNAIEKHLTMVKSNAQNSAAAAAATVGGGANSGTAAAGGGGCIQSSLTAESAAISLNGQSLSNQNAPCCPYAAPNAAGRKSSFVITSVREKNGFDSEDDGADDVTMVGSSGAAAAAAGLQTFRSREKVPCKNSSSASRSVAAGRGAPNANGQKAQARDKRFRNDYSPGLAAVIEQAKVTEIGGKIDKAMDLAKVHLLYAVRSEIKQLKGQIQELDSEMSRLKMENEYLRRHVPLVVLTRLKNITNVRGASKVKPNP